MPAAGIWKRVRRQASSFKARLANLKLTDALPRRGNSNTYVSPSRTSSALRGHFPDKYATSPDTSGKRAFFSRTSARSVREKTIFSPSISPSSAKLDT